MKDLAGRVAVVTGAGSGIGRAIARASKFAVRGLTEALRLELADRGIGVTAVYPGIITTNIAAATRSTTSPETGEVDVPPPVRAHPPEDVARKVVRAIEKNEARVLVGRETYVLDVGRRLMPTVFPRLVRRFTKT